MKALIPAAGQGTRLYPHTHTKPKAMVRIAGKPILGHILSSLSETAIEEVVIVVGGSLKDQITEYARTEFGDRFSFSFPEQESAEGLGHSVYEARAAVGDSPVLIALGDMLFENGYSVFLSAHSDFEGSDGSIGLKRVDEPSHYGVAELDGDRITNLVEKPDDPPSDYAISGVYIVENTPALFESLEYLVDNDVRGAGDEYQLTDALQRMLDSGKTLHAFEVEDWYDCGRPETLLAANRVCLSKLETTTASNGDSSVLIPPVDIGDDAVVEASVVGPNVSLDEGAEIRDSIVRESIVGRGAVLEGVNIEESLVGDNATVQGEANHLNVGDNSDINL